MKKETERWKAEKIETRKRSEQTLRKTVSQSEPFSQKEREKRNG